GRGGSAPTMPPDGSTSPRRSTSSSTVTLMRSSSGSGSARPLAAEGELGPVELGAVAPDADVFEQGAEVGLDAVEEEALAVDADLDALAEVEVFGGEPDVQRFDAADGEDHQVAHRAGLALDRGGVE